jgi:hypothetical protein
VSVMRTGIDPALVDRVRRGEYEVDARAVAEAMIDRLCGGGPSLVLVAAQPLDRAAVGADEDEPAAGDDFA